MRPLSHKLLLDEPIIAIHPRVARELGPEAAILLQQLHFRSRGQSHPKGLWTVVQRGEDFWVSWAPEGRALDVPLARAAIGGGEAAFRRVVDFLVREELIFVSQLLKSSWNRSNFLRLNYETFAARFIDGECSATRGDEIADSKPLRSAISNGAESAKHKGEKLEDETRESEHADALSAILDPFVSRRNGDDPHRDRRRLREIEKLVCDGELTIEDVRQIASDPEVCFASELVERGKSCAKGRRQRASERARVAREAAENAHHSDASNRQKQRVEAMRGAVELLPPHELDSFCGFVATRLGSTTLRERVLAAIRTRKLELPHIAAAALGPFEEWRQSETSGAAHA